MPPTGPVDLKKAISFTALKDRNVLITGGASGLGKAMVHMFADHGANIVVGDIQDNLGAALENELSSKAKYVDTA
jgi:NAD(P)-dependent dehydrogenase (short-subunit alcohol dehydrogenase family)